MLLSFTVQNYLSFKDKTTFSLEASSITELAFENTLEAGIGGIKLLKGAAIYGPNGGGKSNLFKAINFAIRFAQNSAKDYQANERIHVRPFKLDNISDNLPSSFEIVIVHNSKKYKFGFTADANQIHKEYLFIQWKNKEYLIFERTIDSITVEEKYFVPDTVKQLTRKNALFLSTAAMLNIEWAYEILLGFSSIKFIKEYNFNPRKPLDKTAEMLNDPLFKPLILKFIKMVDLGIEDIKSETLSLKTPSDSIAFDESSKKFFFNNDVNIISTIHQKIDNSGTQIGNVLFDLVEESSGTQKYLFLAGPIIEALYYGYILLIDEFTSHLHPLIAEAIIRLFHSAQINKNNAQIVIITHNTYLLNTELFRRDQIFIARRDKFYCTKLSNFYEEKLRKDATFEKRYLHDRELGGVPNISTITENEFWK